MAKLILIRHGNTSLNSAARFWGSTDVDLSAEGISQAERLRDRLAGENLDHIYTSTLSRARVTAEIIAGGRAAGMTAVPELREIDFGELEGLTYGEIVQRHPEMAEAMDKWSPNPLFPGGESLADLDMRVRRFITRLPEHGPEETVLIVSHAGTLRLLICDLLGISLEHWRHMQLDLASVSILNTYPQGAILRLLNDVSHLK